MRRSAWSFNVALTILAFTSQGSDFSTGWCIRFTRNLFQTIGTQVLCQFIRLNVNFGKSTQVVLMCTLNENFSMKKGFQGGGVVIGILKALRKKI